MKINCKKLELLRVFDEAVLKPFRVLSYDYTKLDMDIILGENPNKEFPYPHIDLSKKPFLLVIPYYNYTNLWNRIINGIKIFTGKLDDLLFADNKNGMHEIGHFLHMTEKIDWEEWARETGHELDLEYRGERRQVPSYEDFANDFSKLIDYSLPDYYFKAFGLEKTKDYHVLENLEILKRAGYLKPAFYYSTRKGILDKY